MNETIAKWLEEVSNGCHEIASRNETYPDFYVFQSEIFESPDLLIIGANPAGVKTYKEASTLKNIKRREAVHLSSGGNQYLENNGTNWHINKPIIEIFSTNKLRKMLEKAVIMNVVYFNSNKVADLKSNFGADGKEMIQYCTEKTKEFIEIIMPKNILFIGLDGPKWLKLNYNKEDGVLKFDLNNNLIWYKNFNGIPSYQIYHTSLKNSKFNNQDSLLKKRDYFEKHL